MIYTFIAEQCSDLPVATCCRVMKVSPSGFYQRRRQPVTDAELAEAHRNVRLVEQPRGHAAHREGIALENIHSRHVVSPFPVSG